MMQLIVWLVATTRFNSLFLFFQVYNKPSTGAVLGRFLQILYSFCRALKVGAAFLIFVLFMLLQPSVWILNW